jgi:hypothetical protein
MSKMASRIIVMAAPIDWKSETRLSNLTQASMVIYGKWALTLRCCMAEPIYCATVIYPFAEDTTFDVERYAREIAPRYAELLGDNCTGYEVRQGRTSPGRPHPDYACIASFWVRSAEAFGQSLGSAQMRTLMAEIDAFSPIRPIRQFDVCHAARYPG